MQSFISETIDDILKTNSSFEDSVFILPSQRAGVFLRNELKRKIVKGFLPEIITIEKFTEQISDIKLIDSIQLLFHFYTTYKEVENANAVAFENFSSWAFVVLQDFNEIDQYLINSNDIFAYLKDIQRLRKWSVKGEFKQTELVKDHFIFMEKLHHYYTRLYGFLSQNKMGYQGLIYRECVKNTGDFIKKNKHKSFYFIGFNALNYAEENLFQQFLSTNKAEIYWDIDKSFYQSNHTAGNFIRKYTTQWEYYETNEPKLISNFFHTEKKIEVLGGAKNIAQLKYAGQIMEKFQSYENTALVLGDESLLPVALSSLPKEVDAINITMGYPLQNIPTSNFIISFFHLFTNQEKFQKTKSNEFYYKDVIQFLENPLLYQLISKDNHKISSSIGEQISKENRTFVSIENIQSYIKGFEEENAVVFLKILAPFQSIDNFIDRILLFLESIKDRVSTIEKEYLYRFYAAFMQLKNLQSQFNYFANLKTLLLLYRRILSVEKLFFQGEPLQGLQIMGMLETRALDFENLIITSVNEQIIPSSSTQNSFIPFDVKIQFGLPTYKEKDAVYSYHFFRLLQRAKNIYLLYNTENDSFGSGEKSRFISQLELMRSDIVSKVITSKVTTKKRGLKEVEKTETVLEKLKLLAEKGISPSTITNYLYNPIAFYKQKILGINELELVEETVAANTLGTIIHDILEELYKPFVNQFLSVGNFDSMKKKSKNLMQKYFAKHFRNGETRAGKNRLIFEVANRYIGRFLTLEKNNLKQGNQIKIIATEQQLETIIQFPEIRFPVKIKGIVDRIDEYNGITRIIDYKTGLVNATDLKIVDLSIIKDFKYSKAIQVFLYALLYTKLKEYSKDKPIEAGVYSFKNLKEGFLKINFSSNYRNPKTNISQEKLEEATAEIGAIISEIYNPLISFKEPTELLF